MGLPINAKLCDECQEWYFGSGKMMRKGEEDMLELHKMIAELWQKKKHGIATKNDNHDFERCMNAWSNIVWKITCLENESKIAGLTNDLDWQHEVCAKLDELKDKLYS